MRAEIAALRNGFRNLANLVIADVRDGGTVSIATEMAARETIEEELA